MPILSEHKGAINWLKGKGHNPQFAQYILNLFKKQTGIEFYEVSFKPNNGKDFQKLTSWYSNQDLTVLKKDFKIYVAEKLRQKENWLVEYYNSDWHKIIIANQDKPRNNLYKEFFKGKVSFEKFKTYYRKSKQYLQLI